LGISENLFSIFAVFYSPLPHQLVFLYAMFCFPHTHIYNKIIEIMKLLSFIYWRIFSQVQVYVYLRLSVDMIDENLFMSMAIPFMLQLSFTFKVSLFFSPFWFLLQWINSVSVRVEWKNWVVFLQNHHNLSYFDSIF
jgi:hypothetical protein